MHVCHALNGLFIHTKKKKEKKVMHLIKSYEAPFRLRKKVYLFNHITSTDTLNVIVIVLNNDIPFQFSYSHITLTFPFTNFSYIYIYIYILFYIEIVL